MPVRRPPGVLRATREQSSLLTVTKMTGGVCWRLPNGATGNHLGELDWSGANGLKNSRRL